jgi:hypothetical protein
MALARLTPDNYLEINGQRSARVDLLGDEFNRTRIEDLLENVNLAFQGPKSEAPAAASAPPSNDTIRFLVAHHVPFIGPDVGDYLVRIIRRLEDVKKVYPLPPGVEEYRKTLYALLELARAHQQAFCEVMEEVLKED